MDDTSSVEKKPTLTANENRQSDRSSAEFHESLIEKLDGTGDNGSIPHISVTSGDLASNDSRRSVDGSMDKSLDGFHGRMFKRPSSRGSDLNLLEASGKSSIGENGSRSGADDGRPKKKKWYSTLGTNYKSRLLEFHKLFKVPKDEKLIVDYACAYQKDILIQGRMYISQKRLCFYANILTWETVLSIPCKSITTVTKEKTARVIPNAIQITTSREKLFFTSFASRDKAYLMIFRIWQNALLDQQWSSKESWQWVRSSYGDDLGLTCSDDDDYRNLSGFEELQEKADSTCALYSQLGENGASEDNHDSQQEPSAEISHIQASVPSYDAPLTANNVQPDMDSSGEDSTGEVVCTDHDHLTHAYLNETFELPVDKVFEFLFTDSKFFRDFCAARKTFNLQLPDWNSKANSNGNREREINYTLTLSASIGPKYSPSYERQVYHKECQSGFIYVIDAHCYNGGIPYADAFYVTNRYCITRITAASCRVKVTSNLEYTKSIWSLVKNMIEKNARHGLTVYFQQLATHLRKEAKKYQPHISPRHAAKKTRRRRKLTEHSSAEAENAFGEQTTSIGVSARESLFGFSADNLVRLLCFILLLLFVFNAIIFYKLFYIESLAASFQYNSFVENLDQLQKSPPLESKEWLSLLARQQKLHNTEVEKWREVLSGVITILDQIKLTMIDLKDMLDQHKVADFVPPTNSTL